ncbi:hypothetical protein O3Q51_02110 [Cryomorphaceae bacterium 1068]|nr:hypothetical protein [Cryomorphaceae bacterium 1068]
MKSTILTSVFLLVSFLAFGQSLTESWEAEQNYRQTGMMVLGSWAVANIASGLVMRSNTTGVDSRFWEMNAIWNGVNLAIAGFGYFSAAKLGTDGTALELLQEQMGIDKTLLFNAGLDLGYIAAGAWMIERSKNVSKNPDLWKGYGRSIMFQGAFLFAFDVAMVLIHKKVVIGENMILSLNAAPGGVGAILQF